ncbi:MAG: hypothetical protein ACE366_18965 [Bradymonadia bacterium]
MRHLALLLFSFSLSFVLWGCGEDTSSADTTSSPDLTCPAGDEGCVCLPGADGEVGTCRTGPDGRAMACEDNICRVTECPAGTAGCACGAFDSCEAGSICQSGQCIALDCTLGTLDCACDAGSCVGGAACVDDRCIDPGCTLGTEGCLCADGQCGDGFACEDNTCVDPCPAGTMGCACDNGQCGANMRCAENLCVASDCTPGELDCICENGACGEGLACGESGLCTIAPGLAGGACLEDGTCSTGALCNGGLCEACTLGTRGCACADGACFGDGVCIEGVCGDDPLAGIPTNPVCYSVCNDSFEDEDGVWRSCSSDGLMEGCLDGRSCDEGACLKADEERRTCTADYECPDYQACIGGLCYSNCESDRDCGDGTECYRKVCRTPCRTDDEENACTGDSFCSTVDAEAGYCMPLAPATGEESQTEVLGTISLSKISIALSPADPEGQLVITNTAPTAETVTVRKLSHTRFYGDGSWDTLEDVDDDTECNPAVDCPMTWLTMGEYGEDGERVQSMEVTIEAGEEKRLVFDEADRTTAVRWQGVLEIVHPELNNSRVTIEYVETPEGTWSGNIFYFGSFGTADLDTWAALPNPAPGSGAAAWENTKDDANIQEIIGNAFVQRWGAFRRGRLNGGWEEFQAVLTATQTESWRWANVQADCPDDACYLYDSNRLGLVNYSSDIDTVPVPGGVVELPFAVNIYQPNEDAPEQMLGRIDSSTALQYAGNPSFSITFNGDPSSCAREVGGTCLVYIEDMQAEIAVGGRYETTGSDTTCAAHDGSYVQVVTPWLLTDFARNTTEDPDNGNRYRYSCRDQMLPYQQGVDPEGEAAANLGLVGSNPIPDGRPRRRTLELVDGALVNQTSLFILFKESFESFLDPDGEPLEAYGYMVLTRQGDLEDDTDANGDMVPDLFQGSDVTDDRTHPEGMLDVTCSDAVVTSILGFNGELTDATAGDLVTALIEGTTAPEQATLLTAADDEQPHYICFDEGTFDGECPAESRVLFFTVLASEYDESDLTGMGCNDDGSCLEELLDWRDQGQVVVQYDVAWRCEDDNRAFCADNRYDLREGKVFYAAGDGDVVASPIRPRIDEAFRYKTRFRNRQGTSVGFAPQECLEDSNQIPYCYDPAAIEVIREEVDCLLHLQSAWYDSLSASEASTLDTYLNMNFASIAERNDTGELINYDGFERLYAELLIMLGDEALTSSFASRFDLAGQNTAAFEGSLFEENGIDLSGQVGYELYTLYQSVQYYQEALDRFYALSPTLWAALGHSGSSRNFVTLETVTRYFDRLIRASAQKTKSWSEIAKRYQAFNRPDLSRAVIERAYTGAYLEGIVMSNLMLKIGEAVAPEERPQIAAIIEDTQRRYRIALLDMRDAYAGITEEQTFFGLEPDYVPIPALDSEDFRQSNGFEVLLRRTQVKVDVAAERESQAIESDRSFDTDSAEFQAELVRIRNTYEDQLAQICGTFEGDDGVIYPAITRYADKTDFTAALGDPCGFVGNGDLTSSYGEFETLQIDLQRSIVQMENVIESVYIEEQRAEQQCQIQLDIAEYVYEAEGRVQTLETAIAVARFAISRADRTMNAISTYAQLTKCDPTSGECVAAGIAAGTFAAAQVGVEVGVAIAEAGISAAEYGISQIQRETARWQTEAQCQVIFTDANARTADMLLRMKELELEMARAEYQIKLQLSASQKLRQQATRLQQQQAEAEQLQVNTEAARNDPNVRIYRNDAIINADIAYEDAMREAYRLTRVFEYYTSQSYAYKEQLYFIRLISRGEDNLENYVTDISNAFYEFEEEFGLPDTRVLQVSLMNDILAIPRVSESGTAYSDAERTALLREALQNPEYLDDNGYLSLPFSTDLEALSPLTRNHKVLNVEAEIIASDFGDDHLARLYLRQNGTGVIRSVEGERQYYRMPSRTAVLNPFFSGVRFFDASIYKNYRLRDRPLVNTSWSLIINQRDELVNQDIDLQSVSDIRLFIYYSDFTAEF